MTDDGAGRKVNRGERPRGIAVFDIGSTNTKMILFDGDLNIVAEESVPSAHPDGPPYKSIDPDPAIRFAQDVLPDFDAMLPVDAIVPSAHGSGLALLTENSTLALPIMDYEAEPPADIVESYATIEPPFSEVFAPTNPGGLTLARQLHWQETRHAEAFATVRSIVPWGQLIAHRLAGPLVNEVTAMGAQTHLWNVKANRYSSLARARGWDQLFAPLARAWDSLGPLQPDLLTQPLNGDAQVLTGIHDSNANFLRYLT
ncbi:MAG: FGGY family carbohydrate kinase, partial [Pseudomonadota bacterium]